MRRRKFIALLGAAAAAWPCVGRAQQSSSILIGPPRRETQVAAAQVAITLVPFEIRNADQLDEAFATFTRERASGAQDRVHRWRHCSAPPCPRSASLPSKKLTNDLSVNDPAMIGSFLNDVGVRDGDQRSLL